MLPHELRHAVLHIGVAHDERSESSNHIQCTETLRRSWVAKMVGKVREVTSVKGRQDALIQNIIDEAENGHESRLPTAIGELQQEGSGGSDRRIIVLVFV